jgi:hypothetical protein
MATPKERDTRALNEILNSTLAILRQFSSSLSDSTPTSAPAVDNPPDPLKVLSDSAKLVKAHTTKLSLLAINKPFTPSAITKVIKELAAPCLPAMMSAVQICEQDKAVWGEVMSKEVRLRAKRIVKELEMLLGEVSSIASGGQMNGRRDSLSSTGVVWESCDAVIELETEGIAGLCLKKAQQYQDTLKDALKELKEWKEGDDLEFEGQGDSLADSDDEGVDGDKDSLDDIFNAANRMPKDRPELKALVDQAEGKLKKVAILYNALATRRIQTFKSSHTSLGSIGHPTARLDELMQRLRRMPHQVDDLIGKFYDLDEENAKDALEKVMQEAKTACSDMALNWNDEQDGFTDWLSKWSAAVG